MPKDNGLGLGLSTLAVRYFPYDISLLKPFHITSTRFRMAATTQKVPHVLKSWCAQLAPEQAQAPETWPPHNATVSANFPWHVPTNEIYKAGTSAVDTSHSLVNNDPPFHPPFAAARKRLDYRYHCNPLLSRQILQDKILLQAYAKNTVSEQCPWIVFTAGAMAAGKSYALLQLFQKGLFPMNTFVNIDPDKLKSELPEMPGYLQADAKSAATKLHRESTQMSEVLFEYALQQSQRMIVDGSLRDVAWYKTLFARLRKEVPHYRIAIIHVKADKEVIYRRALDRAEQTGRVVPRSVLDASIEQVPKSVMELSPLADKTFHIVNNDNEDIKLECGISWSEFKACWALHEDQACNNPRDVSDLTADALAAEIWHREYPNLCTHCHLQDSVCGRCIHGSHVCKCSICIPSSHLRCATRDPDSTSHTTTTTAATTTTTK